MDRSRADSDINELRTALSFARLEAINKSRSITVAATDENEGVGGGGDGEAGRYRCSRVFSHEKRRSIAG